MKEEEVIICACHSFEHQAVFYEINDDPQFLYVCFHLNNHGIFRRIKYGLKYIFGYKSRYGAWDEFIFDEEGKSRLLNYLNKSDGQE